MLKKIILILVAMLLNMYVLASDFTVHKLPSGQTLIIQEVKTNPIVTIDTWVKTGSINENDNNNGVSHFLEHLFFKGTKLHPAGDFDRILESKGAIVNAATSKDFTHYYITLPSEYFNIALELHSDMLLNPQLPRKELEKERKVVLEEISKDQNTPARKVYENLNSLMYAHHPYKRKVIGTSDIISTIRREEILDYFNKYYSPSNMITIVVGDVNTSEIIQKVTEYFGSKYKKSIKKTFQKENPLTSQKRKIEYTDTNAGYIMLGFRSTPLSNSDTYALDVLSQVLGGGKTSRLHRILKDQKGLVYSISASNGSFRDDGILFVSANFNPKNKDRIENAIFKEIIEIQKNGINEEELAIAKKLIEQDTYYARESTSNIATEIGYSTALTGDTCFYKNYLQNINKVTRNQVQDAAQKYLGINKSAVSLLLPKSLENEAPAKKQNTAHSAEKVSESNGITKYILDNKSILLLNKHNNNDIIAIDIIAKGGEFIEKKIGEGTLAAETILKGTQKYSAAELAQIMEENGIKIIPKCSEDTFSLKVQTTTSALGVTMELLDEILNNALFDDSEIEKKRTEILGVIKQKRDIPMNIALENFKTLIYENSVYSHTNKVIEKYLPSVTREDIANYYNRITDSKNIIISINGNVSAENMIQDFSEMFKDKKNPEFKYSDYKVTHLNKAKFETKKINDLQTAWLFLGWQTSGTNNKKDFVTLKVINTLLGSGMSSRLFRNLREQDGLAYQLGSSYTPRKLGGTFLTYIGTNPESLDKSKVKILHEIERLKSEFVSDSELNDAKERLKGGFIVALETNSEKASTIGLFETVGFGYDFLPEYTKMIDEVSASDILSVANKYFNNVFVESVVK